MATTDQVHPEILKSRIQTVTASRSLQRARERVIEILLLLAALSSVAITVGIVGVLIFESLQFFRHVSIVEFLTDTQWTVLFADPHYGIMPLVSGTLVTSVVALLVSL